MAKGYNKTSNLHKWIGNSSFTLKVSSTLGMTMRSKTQSTANKEVIKTTSYFFGILSLVVDNGEEYCKTNSNKNRVEIQLTERGKFSQLQEELHWLMNFILSKAYKK